VIELDRICGIDENDVIAVRVLNPTAVGRRPEVGVGVRDQDREIGLIRVGNLRGVDGDHLAVPPVRVVPGTGCSGAEKLSEDQHGGNQQEGLPNRSKRTEYPCTDAAQISVTLCPVADQDH
jgi:hypothetical protein